MQGYFRSQGGASAPSPAPLWLRPCFLELEGGGTQDFKLAEPEYVKKTKSK